MESGSSQQCLVTARGNGHKSQYWKFCLNTGKHFFFFFFGGGVIWGEDGQTLKQISQRGCGIFFLGDTQLDTILDSLW